MMRYLFDGLVHGVNLPPAWKTFYCQETSPLTRAGEPLDPDEPITCLACIAVGRQIPTLNGVEVVQAVTDLPRSPRPLAGTGRYVMGHPLPTYWVFDGAEWMKTS